MDTSQTGNRIPTILVVDDAVDNLALINSLLKGKYRVKAANSGRKALEIACSAPPPDLVLLDIMMPEMDGYEVCRQLKASALTATIPVIFLTARSDITDETHGLELGAVDYITKPISPPILMARIETHLRLKDVAEFLRNKNYFLETEVARRTCEVVEANQLNRHIISCVQEGIVVQDHELHYVIWNPFMEVLTGISATEVIGRTPLELFPDLHETGILPELERALAGEAVPAKEFPFTIAATGRSGWIYNTMAPLRNAADEIIGVIRTISDISEQKLIEEQFRHAQKMEVVGQLAGGVAHDFNNILSVIIGYGELLRMPGELTKKQDEQIEQILNASERASQLTRGLLTFSHKQVALPQLENINSVVQNVQKFLERILGEGIQLQLNLCAEELPVLADSSQIEQVVINLATNARDAMQSRGVLQIATCQQELDETFVAAHGHCEPGSYARIDVSDSGSGMNQTTLERVFEPFFTTKEVGKGTGLGMAIISGIVLQHNGAITITSTPGEGTTFSIYLPLVTSAPATSERIALPQALPKGTETILVAEDDTSLRALLTSILVEYGYKVIAATDGQDAVDKFTLQGDRIDLLLTDVVMPRKNGKEVVATIRRVKPDVSVLFMSGQNADVINECGIYELGMDLITKPLQPRQLLRKIRELLDF